MQEIKNQLHEHHERTALARPPKKSRQCETRRRLYITTQATKSPITSNYHHDTPNKQKDPWSSLDWSQDSKNYSSNTTKPLRTLQWKPSNPWSNSPRRGVFTEVCPRSTSLDARSIQALQRLVGLSLETAAEVSWDESSAGAHIVGFYLACKRVSSSTTVHLFKHGVWLFGALVGWLVGLICLVLVGSLVESCRNGTLFVRWASPRPLGRGGFLTVSCGTWTSLGFVQVLWNMARSFFSSHSKVIVVDRLDSDSTVYQHHL